MQSTVFELHHGVDMPGLNLGVANDDVHLDQIMRLNRVENDKRAVCLDGTSPVYYFRQGYGGGRNNFMIYLQGGGWCYKIQPEIKNITYSLKLTNFSTFRIHILP